MSSGDAWDELIGRARQNAEGAQAPETWGESIRLEVDDAPFIGRYRGRGTDPQFKSPAFLFWDLSGQPRFILSCSRLERGFDPEPPVGADVVIVRNANYRTQFDAPGGASGLGYGVSWAPNAATLPGSDPGDDDGIPFLCQDGRDTRSVPAAVAATG